MSNANETVLTDQDIKATANSVGIVVQADYDTLKDGDDLIIDFARAIEQAVRATQGTIANDPSVLNADESHLMPTGKVLKWALYYDNLGEQQYDNEFMRDWRLFKSKEDALESMEGRAYAKHYSAVQVEIRVASQPSAQPIDTPVPKGYVLVPIEPTAMLVEAGYSKHYRLDTTLGRQKACADYAQITRVALAINAAPQVAQPSAEAMPDRYKEALLKIQKLAHSSHMVEAQAIEDIIWDIPDTPPTVDQDGVKT